MSNWQKDLDKKAQELNIKKEENNGQVISSTRIGDRNNRGSSSDVYRLSLHKEIKNFKEKEVKVMIPSKGLFDDYNAIDKEAIGAAEKVWKYIPKLIKVILNCRTNTVKIMDKLGISREEGKQKEPETK